MSGGKDAPLTLPSSAYYVGYWCDFDSILISFFFCFFLQSIKFDIDPLRVSIDPFVVLQKYIAGKWEMSCYRR